MAACARGASLSCGEARAAFGELLAAHLQRSHAQLSEETLARERQKAFRAPLIIVVPRCEPAVKIPWSSSCSPPPPQPRRCCWRRSRWASTACGRPARRLRRHRQGGPGAAGERCDRRLHLPRCPEWRPRAAAPRPWGELVSDWEPAPEGAPQKCLTRRSEAAGTLSERIGAQPRAAGAALPYDARLPPHLKVPSPMRLLCSVAALALAACASKLSRRNNP